LKNKKIVALLLIGILLFTQGLSVSALTMPNDNKFIEIGIGDDFIVTPDWINVNNISLDMFFSNGTVSCVGIISGAAGTTNIAATFTLEQRTSSGWSFVKSWDRSTTSSTLIFSDSASGSSGNTFRLSVVAVVIRNGVSETVRTSVEGSF
jgi:hypothetical protein